MSQRLHAAAPDPKALLLILQGEHANRGRIGGVQYNEGLTAFVGKHLKRTGQADAD
jgi:hypothetical protein